MLCRRHILTGLALLPASALVPRVGVAGQSDIYAEQGIAIRGADAVAYFQAGAYAPGDPRYAVMWRGATWHFTSMENRDAFEMDPGTFCPRFGGYCAYALAEGQLVASDPAAFTVYEGRLYLNYSMQVRRQWAADKSRYIAQAEANWPGVLNN